MKGLFGHFRPPGQSHCVEEFSTVVLTWVKVHHSDRVVCGKPVVMRNEFWGESTMDSAFVE